MNVPAKFDSRKHVAAIDPEYVIARALAETGLIQHLDEGLKDRVRDIAGRINARGLITRENAATVELHMAGLLVTRLTFADTQARYPEIAQEKIDKPVVVIGYARTGSTIMHSLLGADPAGRTPQEWEVFYPSPPPGISPETIPARIAAADRDILELMAHIEDWSFHPYFDRLGQCIAECDEIFTLDFRTASVARYALAPAALLDTTMADNEGGFAFHASMLKQLQYKRDIGHWVVKGTLHQMRLKALFETYPDAICVYTHRNPLETVGSVLRSAELFIEGYEGTCELAEHARETTEGIAAIYDSVVDNPLIDDPRIIHIRFQDFMADHVGTIRGIYEQAGMEFTPAYEQAIRAWLDNPANKSDRYGKFKYSLEDYGLDSAAVAGKFERYIERFDLQ